MSIAASDFSAFVQLHQPVFEEFLSRLLPLSLPNDRLSTAMRYSALNGGKRLRPMLVYAIAQLLGTPLSRTHAAAAGIELIHCYSLIHDDLPAMDDDDFRRGKPSCHKAFDEATAILAGDALQTLAFQILSDPELNKVEPKQQIWMVNTLAKAAGNVGMILGQADDLAAEHKKLDLFALCLLHKRKTGALFNACIELSFIASDHNQDLQLLSKLLKFGEHLGLAFQVQDDVLDVVGDPSKLGKPNGSDQKHNKATFCSILGLDAAKNYAQQQFANALLALENLEMNTALLKKFISYMQQL